MPSRVEGQKISPAVQRLEKSEPDKFSLLLRFEETVKSNKILSNNDQLKNFGGSISKDFQIKKSRKETINFLMKLLSEFSVSEIERFLSSSKLVDSSSGHDGYQRLAKYLIEGQVKN